MSRTYDDNQTLQQKIMNGANILTDNVASTLGPRGRNVLLQEKDKEPFVTKDGVTVARFVALEDAFENASVQIIRQAAIETNNDAGDGTTTATVLARAILSESQKFIASGVSPVELQRGIKLAVKEVVKNLKEASRPVASANDIEHIATISANNDHSIGKLIAMAVDRVGQDGTITIEESRSIDTSVDITEGFKFDSGFAAAAFITDERRSLMYHEDPLILVTDYKISNVEPILPLLETAARESRPLIVVAEDVEGQALAAMIMNAMRGTLKVAAIKAPRYGEERRNILDDLAISVGATFVSRASGLKLKDVDMTHLGTAKFIESTKNFTTIVGSCSDYEKVEQRIETLTNLISDTDSLPDCARIQERIVRLGSAVALIKVGGATQVEMTEKKHRIEDALEAVRSAQEEGIVPGGGTALLRASQEMVIVTSGADPICSDLGYGAVIVQQACRQPITQMALNSGESPDLIINEVLKSDKFYGWDFRAGRLKDLVKEGVIDPTKVARCALQNAASCAGTLITTNFGIIQTED
jgi:chaperonin GroEL|tara:strand:- start:2881 stop:4470 length:1590 start_codon:yes stop_codon:yes gene_type:complete